MYQYTGYYGMHMGWWVFWGFLWIAMFSFWTPVSRRTWQSIKEAPIDILKRRLANGDINEQQYENLRAHLGRDRDPELSTGPRRAV